MAGRSVLPLTFQVSSSASIACRKLATLVLSFSAIPRCQCLPSTQLPYLVSAKLYLVAGGDYGRTPAVHGQSRGAQVSPELQVRAARKIEVAFHFLEGGSATTGREGR